MNRVIEYVLDLIYPPKCSFCRKVTDKGMDGVCPACREKLPLLSDNDRRRILDGGFVCLSPLEYDSFVRDSFLRYKFSGFTSYAETYSKILAGCVKNCGLSFDLVTWVPLSKTRKRKRGYDQAELLAKGVSDLLGLDCKGILYKNKETGVQSLTGGRTERKRNVKGAFSVMDEGDVKGRNILIIDDIVTTGATLSECCEVLKRSGAESITAAAFASAVN